MLDFENGGASKHLGEIADSMYEWEGPVAEQLGLTPAEIAAIKLKYPCELGLQTLVLMFVHKMLEFNYSKPFLLPSSHLQHL